MLTAITDWLNTPAFTAFGAPTTWAEVLGFVTGAICVWLVAKQHILNWPLGIANNVLWILLFATAGLYADSGLQVVFIVLSVWGWWQWLHGGRNRTERVVTATSTREWVGLGIAGLAGTAALTWFLATYTGSTVPVADGVTTALSLMATWGQAKKKWESWLLWITADLIYMPLYHVKGLDLTAILYFGFLLLCLKGLREWRTDLSRDRSSLAATGAPVGHVDPEGAAA